MFILKGMWHTLPLTLAKCPTKISSFGVDRVAQSTMSEYTTIQVAKQENMIINLLQSTKCAIQNMNS